MVLRAYLVCAVALVISKVTLVVLHRGGGASVLVLLRPALALVVVSVAIVVLDIVAPTVHFVVTRKIVRVDFVPGREVIMEPKQELQRRYDDLSQFFGGYLNQDCEHIYGGIDQAIEQFVVDATFDERVTVAVQLRRLLREFVDDDVLASKTLALALDVNDGIGRGIPERTWLEEVALKLERTT